MDSGSSGGVVAHAADTREARAGRHRHAPRTGGFADPPGLASTLTPDHWLAAQRRLGLSPQQRRIVQPIITEELKTDAIDLRLGVKPSSVETQLHRLTRKLGVHTRVGVVVRVMWAMMEDGECGRPPPAHMTPFHRPRAAMKDRPSPPARMTR